MKRVAFASAFVVCAALLLACPAKVDTTPAPGDGGGADADGSAVPDGEVDASSAEWKPVVQHLHGTLLSIWGPSSKDLWTVGGEIGNGGEALVLRFDGASWRTLHPGGTETFWWVHGTSATDVWMVGEKGRITHFDGAKLEDIPSGTTATLYGVWAAAPDDAWAVGGTPEQPSSPNDVVLHWDGASWNPEVLPAPTKSALFKVWGSGRSGGSASSDLWVVGENAVMWHRAAGAWRREAEGLATGRLTTVAGCSSKEIYAVGGRDLLVYDGTAWRRDTTTLVNDVNGVSCAPPNAPARDWGRVVVVGGGSFKLRLVNGAFVDDFGSEPFADLHGAFVDETGALWGVGGKFTASVKAGASREGVIARYGTGTIPSAVTP